MNLTTNASIYNDNKYYKGQTRTIIFPLWSGKRFSFECNPKNIYDLEETRRYKMYFDDIFPFIHFARKPCLKFNYKKEGYNTSVHRFELDTTIEKFLDLFGLTAVELKETSLKTNN